MTWEVIIPFLRPIEPYLMDPDISDILVNGSHNVFIERDGRMQLAEGIVVNERSLQVAIRNIARALGDEVSDEKPILDARLPDGSRLAAVFPPCSANGTTLAIRKSQNHKYNGDELVRVGTIPGDVLDRLKFAAQNRNNVLICGAAGSGKTTLLNVLIDAIPREERLVILEDTAEIQADRENLVRLEARRANGDVPAVTIRDLLKATLRLRPDRIILGEVRGGEAFDLLQALNTGHNGSIATIHANSASQAISRFTTCVLQSDVGLPYAAIRASIGDSLDFVVHLERRQHRRVVTEVIRIEEYVVATDHYDLESIYTCDPAGGHSHARR